jgi:hypothetical protein
VRHVICGPIERASALALCVALTGLAAGCGGSSKPAARTTTGTSATSTGSAALVSPEGAVYRYRVPEGFKLVPGKGPGQHLTTVVPSSLPANSGTISAFELTPGDSLAGPRAVDRFLTAFDRQTVAFYRSRGGAVAAGTRTTLAGHSAICWKIGHFENSYSGVVDADACAIVAGGVVVQQGCNWKPSARAIVERGCAAVRASLKVS